jgi:hypothetical protein
MGVLRSMFLPVQAIVYRNDGTPHSVCTDIFQSPFGKTPWQRYIS